MIANLPITLFGLRNTGNFLNYVERKKDVYEAFTIKMKHECQLGSFVLY